MIDINLLRTDPESIKKALQNRGKDNLVVNQLITLDSANRETLKQAETLRAEQNKISKEIKGKPTEEQLKTATKIKEELKIVEEKLKNSQEELNNILEEIPNIPAVEVR